MRDDNVILVGLMLSAFCLGVGVSTLVSTLCSKKDAPAREDGVCPAAASAGNLEARVCAWHDCLRPVACVRVEGELVSLYLNGRPLAPTSATVNGTAPTFATTTAGTSAPLLPKDGAGGEVSRGAGAKPGEGRSERKD